MTHVWKLANLQDRIIIDRIKGFLETHLEDCIYLYNNIFMPDSQFQGDYWICEGTDQCILGIAGVYPKFKQILLHCIDVEYLQGFQQPKTIEKVGIILGPYEQVCSLVNKWNLEPILQSKETLFEAELSDIHLPMENYSVKHSKDKDLPILIDWQQEWEDNPKKVTESSEWITDLHSRQRLYVLFSPDEYPLAMVNVAGRTPKMVQLGGVYVPLEQRSKGYSKLLIAGLLKTIQKDYDDLRKAILFTANPIAIQAYEKVGFKPSGKFYSICIM